MEWMVENDYVENTFLGVYPAVETGRLDMVEFLIEHKLVEAGRALALATEACNLVMSKHLHRRYWQKIRSSRFYPVKKSLGGSILICELPPLWISPKSMAATIQKGDLKFVQWLYETFGSEIDLFDATQVSGWERQALSLDTAARRGNLALVKYLHAIAMKAKATKGKNPAKRAKIIVGTRLVCTTAAMDNAAAGNHLEVVKWLHCNRTEGCTTGAMDRAAGNGHLVVLKWFAAHRSEGCTVNAMNGAASWGHLNIVKWLNRHSSEGCTTEAMDNAASASHLGVLKWLHSYRLEGCTSKAIDEAAKNGHLEVLEWLHTHTSASCTTKTKKTL